MSTKSPACRLVMVVYAGTGAVERVTAAMAVADIATLIIAPADGGVALDAAGVKPLVDLAQSNNVAALLADNAALACTLKADGVHLTWSEDVAARYAEAREILGSRFIAGADAGHSRHTAMALGEANADYIAFGIPPHVEDRDAACEGRLEIVAWWAEIFQLPVVAFDVESVDDAAGLVRAGADFIAITMPSAVPPSKIAGWLRPFLAAIAHHHAPV